MSIAELVLPPLTLKPSRLQEGGQVGSRRRYSLSVSARPSSSARSSKVTVVSWRRCSCLALWSSLSAARGIGSLHAKYGMSQKAATGRSSTALSSLARRYALPQLRPMTTIGPMYLGRVLQFRDFSIAVLCISTRRPDGKSKSLMMFLCSSRNVGRRRPCPGTPPSVEWLFARVVSAARLLVGQ